MMEGVLFEYIGRLSKNLSLGYEDGLPYVFVYSNSFYQPMHFPITSN